MREFPNNRGLTSPASRRAVKFQTAELPRQIEYFAMIQSGMISARPVLRFTIV